MKQWAVASSIIISSESFLLVANRRKNDSIDWSPPGGVVDEGETPTEALTREVVEETGLTVSAWGDEAYGVTVRFVDLGMHLTVNCFPALEWSGALVIDDPDNIVEDAQWCTLTQCSDLLADAPIWVREPFLTYLQDVDADAQGPFIYEVHGERLADALVQRVDS